VPSVAEFVSGKTAKRRHTRLARRVLISALVSVLAAVGLSSCTLQKKAPLRVEFWGDSIGFHAAPYINYFIDVTGKATVRTRVFPATSLCDWLPEIGRELNPANRTAFHPQAVVLEFTGVALYPCMHDAHGKPLAGQAIIDKYVADSATAIALANRAHVPIYFVSPPIYREDASKYVDTTPLGKMFSTLPSRYPGGQVRYIDAAAAVELNGHYTTTLPCLWFEHCTGRWPDGTKTVVVRENDGHHFCPVSEIFWDCPVPSPGAMRYAAAITSRVLHDFNIK
jgi:hypothetical protein